MVKRCQVTFLVATINRKTNHKLSNNGPRPGIVEVYPMKYVHVFIYVTGEFPAQRPVTRSFDVFFDLRLNKRWVNNREAGDLRRHRIHHDVIVMPQL